MSSELFTESYPVAVIGAYALINALCLFLLDHWLCNASIKYRNSVAMRVIVSLLFISAAFLPVLALFIRHELYRYYIERYSYIWMGALMYFGAMILIMTLLEAVVRLIAFIGRRKAPKESAGQGAAAGGFDDGRGDAGDGEKRPGLAGRAFSGVMLILMIAASVGINVYGMEHARSTVITRYSVDVNKTVKNTRSLRVAFVSDLHLSYNTDPAVIRRMVDMINTEEPDVVLVGGDMFSSSFDSVPAPKDYIRMLKGIRAKEGVYWVYGNHDVEEPIFCGFPMGKPEDAVRSKKIKKFLKRSGFRILEDKYTAICKGEVQIVGRADMYKPEDKAEKRLEPDELLEDTDKEKPILVIAHEAGDFEELADEGADVLFSGHTHNGQIFPGNYIIKLFHDVTYGLAEKAGMRVIVTSGVGCYGPPIRVLTDSEIVIADISFGS